MAYPPEYTRTFSFTDFETTNPDDPKPGDSLDIEFDDVSNALTATQENLALIQRADGQLANDSVGEDQLQEGLLDDLVIGITDDAEAAAAAAAASASAAAGSAASAATSASDAAAQVGIAAGHAASAGVSQGVAQTAADDAEASAEDAADEADAAELAANSVLNSVAQAQLHEEMAFKWAEYLAAPVMPAPPGWPEAVDDGMFSAKWWALRARDYNEVHEYDFGTAGTNPGEAFDIWDLTHDLEDPPGLVYMTWGTPPHTYVLTDPSNPSDPNSWMDITGATGPAGPPGLPGATGPAGPPNTLTIGTVTTGAPGSPAAATITGTAPNQVLDMTIPAGADGAGTTLVAATGTIGLTPVAGAATTAARSDSTPALSQAIVPTWAGAHTFNALVNLAGPVQTSGNDGVSGQVLSSQGAGLPAVWRTPGGGAIELGWNFSTSVSLANPGSQKLSMNSAVYTAVTFVTFNTLAMTNFDASTILSLLQAGNRIYIQQRNDATKAVVYQVTGPGTPISGAWNIPVTHVNSISATMFPANADLNCVFILSVSGSAFANPSALVGLTAINGSAGTGMRSDAAPALNQAIAPSWTGLHSFTSTAGAAGSSLQIVSNAPTFVLWDMSQAANARAWYTQAAGSSYYIGVMDDGVSSTKDALKITRAGVAIASMTFGNASDNPTYTFLGTGLMTWRSQTIQHQQAGMSHYLEFVAGNNTNPGYIEWFNGAVRLGYIGYWNSVDRLLITGDTYGWEFSGIPPTIGGKQIATLTSGRLFLGDGTAASPTYSFTDHTNAGLYYDHAANGVALSAQGAQVLMINTAGMNISTPSVAIAGNTLTLNGGATAAINAAASAPGYAQLACQVTATEGLYIIANFSGGAAAGIPTGTTGIMNVVGSPFVFGVAATEAYRITPSGSLQISGAYSGGVGVKLGPSLEFGMASSGTIGSILSYNRNTSAYLPLQLNCNYTDVSGPGVGDLRLMGRHAVLDSNDTYLRLNPSSDYTSGVYTPGDLRTNAWLISEFGVRDAANAYQLRINHAQMAYGSVWATGPTGGYHGFGIEDGGLRPTFMANNADYGIYSQSDAKWLVHRTAATTAATEFNFIAPKFFAGNGLAAVPSISFTNFTSNGFNCLAANNFSALVGGSAVCSFVNNSGQLQVQVANGTVAAPGLCFYADNNTGLLCGGVGDLRASCSGTQVWAVNTSTFTFNVAVSAPSYTSTSSRAIKRETGSPSKPANILARLRPIMYRLLAGDDSEQLGLIAEEVHEVCPQLSDGKSVAYDRLALLLLAAWQEEHLEAA